MTWVLGSTIGDRARKLMLIELADCADSGGRHAWPAVRTLAAAAECSPRTVQRHIPILIEEGWIREGDQQQVAHLRGGQRPVVYDLAMNETARREWASRGDKSAARASAGDDAQTHPAGSQRGDDLSPRCGSADAESPSARGDSLSPLNAAPGVTQVSPLDAPPGVTRGVTKSPLRGDTAVSPKPSTNLRTSPQPPTPGGLVIVGCSKPGPTPHPHCRGCGTTTRQLEAQARRDVAARRRDEDRAAAARSRAERAKPPDPANGARRAECRASIGKVDAS